MRMHLALAGVVMSDCALGDVMNKFIKIKREHVW